MNKRNMVFVLFYLMLITVAQFFLLGQNRELFTFNINLCFVNVILSTILYFKELKKDNFLDFDTIFVIILLIVGYSYPVFLFNRYDPYKIFFGLSFDIGNIPLGTIVYTIGVQSYYLGSLKVIIGKIEKKFEKAINTDFLLIALFMLSILFVFLGGVGHYKALYIGDKLSKGNYVEQVSILLQSISVVFIASEFYNVRLDKGYKVNKIAIFVIFTIVLLMLFAGNRTLAAGLVLPIIVLYALFKKNIKFFGTFVFISLAIFSMYFVQLNRAGYEIRSPNNFSKVISDLVIPARNNYLSLEYTEKFGYTYGESMIGGMIGVIPSLEKILVNWFEINNRKLGSAEIFTDFTLGRFPSVGLGTTIIADLHLAFGFVGVSVFMFLLGHFSMRLYRECIFGSYYYLVSYAAITSFAVFWVRTTYFHPLRLLIWCLLIAKINKLINSRMESLSWK